VELIALPSATSSAFAVRIDRANATWCRRAENASRNRFAMIGQQSLPQLVVYGNLRGGRDHRPEAPIICKFLALGALSA